MFKFSFNWVNNICKTITPLKEMLNILNLQGFEVKSCQEVDNDNIITVEVKANRPDILSHIGIAREICEFKNIAIPRIPKNTIEIDNDNFPLSIKIVDSDICSRFSGIIIKDIDNTVKTPDYIKSKLESLGINCINAVVDIANYIMLEFGQPMHTYDLDKIEQNIIKIYNSKEKVKIHTLGHVEIEVPKDSILISDSSKILCLAGIIGEENSAID